MTALFLIAVISVLGVERASLCFVAERIFLEVVKYFRTGQKGFETR